MADPAPRRVVLSPDRREMTIITQTPAGVHRAVLGRGAEQEPFTDEEVRRAAGTVLPTLSAPGQRNTTRRWVTPFGTVYGHLMLGPPTWWLPKVELRHGELMVGWLRAAVAVGFRRDDREGVPVSPVEHPDTPSVRIRFRRWRVRQAERLFARSRAARFVFLAALFPFVWLADKMQGVDPPASWSTGMYWVRTGRDVRRSTIRTADEPAVANRSKTAGHR